MVNPRSPFAFGSGSLAPNHGGKALYSLGGCLKFPDNSSSILDHDNFLSSLNFDSFCSRHSDAVLVRLTGCRSRRSLTRTGDKEGSLDGNSGFSGGQVGRMSGMRQSC